MPEQPSEDTTRGYYDAYWAPEGFSPTGIAPDDVLMRLFRSHVTPGAVVIDVGCGDGMKTGPAITGLGGAYTGFDLSEVAVGLARGAGLEARQITDAAELPVADESVDVAVIAEVLEHLLFPREAADELRRVLRPGGVCIATVPNIAAWRNRVDLTLLGRWHPGGDDRAVAEPWRDPHIRFFTVHTLPALFRDAGFDVSEPHGWNGRTVLERVPGAPRGLRARPAGRVTKALSRRWPAMFGHTIAVVAVKPA